MDEVDDALAAAWERVKVCIADKPAELRKRLARIGRASLNKTPRARCLAVRANDLRIEGTVVEAGGKHRRHNVWLYGDEAQQLCAPVEITPPGETVEEVAARLGVTRMGLLSARLKGVFHTHHVAGLGGRWGHPVPLIYTARQLDPNARHFALADPIWGWLARDLYLRMPEDFVQTVVRVPCFWLPGGRYAEDVPDWEEAQDDERRQGRRRYKNPPRRLPPPEPDYVGYKWKDGVYLGYDWRNPLAKQSYERHQRRLAQIRAARAERVRRHPPESRASGSIAFRGWRWLCPVCEKPVKVLFYPMPAVSKLQCALMHYSEELPKWFLDGALAAIDEERARPVQFACSTCNRVARFSRVSDNMWNEVVSCLSRGLLYGREVERPACVTSQRKLAFVTHKQLPRPVHVRRRQQVCAGLIKGWGYKRMAQEFGISYYEVCGSAQGVFKQHGVHGRRELAEKLGAPLEGLMSKWARVCAGVVAGKSNAQIAAETGIKKGIVASYAWKFRRRKRDGAAVGARSMVCARSPGAQPIT